MDAPVLAALLGAFGCEGTIGCNALSASACLPAPFSRLAVVTTSRKKSGRCVALFTSGPRRSAVRLPSSRLHCLARLFLWFGAVISAGGCYVTEASWKVCCGLMIVGDNTSTTDPLKTIIDWQSWTSFRGDGSAVDSSQPPLPGTWKTRRIGAAIAHFLASNPKAQARDYFVSLGMACKPETSPRGNVTRCESVLPVSVECVSLNVYFPGGASIPKELQKPIPATLQVNVIVSTSTLIDTSTQILPLPGGRLCHR